MEKVRIEAIDETYSYLNCDQGVLREISEHFKFFVPEAKYHPMYKNKIWDGYIRLVNTKNSTFYKGMIHEILKYCQENSIEFEVEEELKERVSNFDVDEFFETLSLRFDPFDHQKYCVKEAIQNNRALILSPTGSGKSYIMYSIMRYYCNDFMHRPIFVVPFVDLIHQLPTEFVNYGNDKFEFVCRKMHDGKETYYLRDEQLTIEEAANISKKKEIPIVTFATWQSIYKKRKEWFLGFDSIFGDEAHRFVSKSIQSILQKMPHCKYRFAFTGTLDGSKTNELTLIGLFGKMFRSSSVQDLIDRDLLAPMDINCVQLDYSNQTKKDFHVNHNSYADEVEFLCQNQKRNEFLLGIAQKSNKNSLFLFNLVEKHGKKLLELFHENIKDKNIFFIYGNTSTEYRKHVRELIDSDEQIVFHFENEISLHCTPNQEVLLENKIKKKAKDVTENDKFDKKFVRTFSNINNFK